MDSDQSKTNPASTVIASEDSVADVVSSETSLPPRPAREEHRRFNRNQGQGGGQRRDSRPRRSRRDRNRNEKRDQYNEKLVSVRRVTKVTKGGRRFRFSAYVLIGDGKGTIGFGKGKANEAPDAIKKAAQHARAHTFKVNITAKSTIPHEIIGKFGAAQILLKPAPAGTGIIAGGPVRTIMELAGINNIAAKSTGSSNAVNMVLATIHGLQQLKSMALIMELRGLDRKQTQPKRKEQE